MLTKGTKGKMSKIIRLEDFSKLNNNSRLKLVREYPIKCVREKNYNIDIIVNGRNGQVWCPIDYCASEVFLFPELESLADELRAKGA